MTLKRFSSRRVARLAVFLAMLLPLLLLAGCGGTDLVEVDAAKAKDIIAQRQGQANFVILDIRTPKEFRKGHIEGAIYVDYHNDAFKQNLDKLDKNPTYLLYCRSGGRTGRSLALFEELGFKSIVHMKHGLREWKELGFPLVEGD